MSPVDLERVAALVEGTLDGAERREAICLVAESPDAYEAFADALASVEGMGAALKLESGAYEPEHASLQRFRASVDRGAFASEEDAPVEPDPPTPWWTSPRRRALVPVAAAAAAAALFLVRGPAADSPESLFDAARLASALDVTTHLTGLTDGLDQTVVPVFRGETIPGTVEGRSFRLGVSALKMEGYARIARLDEARRSTDAMLRILSSMDAAPTVTIPYRHISAGFADGHPVDVHGRSTADRSLDLWLATIGRVAQARYRFGKGTEAARLAITSGDVAFLQTPEGRAFLDLIDEVDLTAAEVETLAELLTLVEPGLTPDEGRVAAQALSTVMARVAY